MRLWTACCRSGGSTQDRAVTATEVGEIENPIAAGVGTVHDTEGDISCSWLKYQPNLSFEMIGD